MPNISDIRNIRSDTPGTRDRLKAMTMPILDGPVAAEEDKSSQLNVGYAYLLIRHTLSHEDRHYYYQRHNLPTSTVNRWKADFDAGLISYVDGKFIRDEPERKPRTTKAQEIFASVLQDIKTYADNIGVIHIETAQRYMYAKSKNSALEGRQLRAQVLLLAQDPSKPWNTLACAKTVSKLLRDHGLRNSPVEHTKAPPLPVLVKPALHYQREALRMFANAGPCRIINCDQTCVNPFLGPCRGYYNSEKQNRAQVTVDPRVTVTVMLSVCDDGTMLPPFIIDKGESTTTKAYDPRKIIKILNEIVTEVTTSETPIRKYVKFDAAELKVNDIELPHLPTSPGPSRRSPADHTDTDDMSGDNDPYDDATPQDDGSAEDEAKSGVLGDTAVRGVISKQIQYKIEENEYLSRGMLSLPCVEEGVEEVFRAMKRRDRSQPEPEFETKRVKFQRLIQEHEAEITNIENELKCRDPLDPVVLDKRYRRFTKRSEEQLQAMMKDHKQKRDNHAKSLANVESLMDGAFATRAQIRSVLRSEPFESLTKTIAQRLIRELNLENMDDEEVKAHSASYIARNEEALEKITESKIATVPCDKMLYTTQRNGWTDLPGFIEYLQRVVVPAKKDGVRTILVLDQFYVHYLPEVLKFMKDNAIYPIYVPRSCTPYCQPLDIAIMKHFKSVMRTQVNYLDEIKNHGKLNTGYNIVLSGFARTLAACAGAILMIKPEHILNGFRAAFTRHPIESMRQKPKKVTKKR